MTLSFLKIDTRHQDPASEACLSLTEYVFRFSVFFTLGMKNEFLFILPSPSFESYFLGKLSKGGKTKSQLSQKVAITMMNEMYMLDSNIRLYNINYKPISNS